MFLLLLCFICLLSVFMFVVTSVWRKNVHSCIVLFSFAIAEIHIIYLYYLWCCDEYRDRKWMRDRDSLRESVCCCVYACVCDRRKVNVLDRFLHTSVVGGQLVLVRKRMQRRKDWFASMRVWFVLNFFCCCLRLFAASSKWILN